MQIVFLPFHDVAVTIVHRLAVLADIVLLLLIGVFLMRSEMTFFGAFWRTAVHNPGSLVFGVAVLVAALVRVGLCRPCPAKATATATSASSSGTDGALFGIFPRNLNVTDADLAGGKDVAGERPSICAAAICASPGSTAPTCTRPT